MAEYIDRDALLKEIYQQKAMSAHNFPRSHFVVGDVLACIQAAPAADVAPVVHGRWENIPLNMDSSYFAYKLNLRKKCTACHYAMPQKWPNFNICPNCGAKMDLEESNDLL